MNLFLTQFSFIRTQEEEVEYFEAKLNEIDALQNEMLRNGHQDHQENEMLKKTLIQNIRWVSLETKRAILFLSAEFSYRKPKKSTASGESWKHVELSSCGRTMLMVMTTTFRTKRTRSRPMLRKLLSQQRQLTRSGWNCWDGLSMSSTKSTRQLKASETRQPPHHG